MYASGWLALWLVFRLLMALGILAFLIWAVAGGRATSLLPGPQPGPQPGPAEPPEDILRRRYARGELDRDTYLRMLEDLKR